jgi:hypothetical protein
VLAFHTILIIILCELLLCFDQCKKFVPVSKRTHDSTLEIALDILNIVHKMDIINKALKKAVTRKKAIESIYLNFFAIEIIHMPCKGRSSIFFLVQETSFIFRVEHIKVQRCDVK